MPKYACQKHHLHWWDAHYLTKASYEISTESLKDFWSKGGKSEKNASIMHTYAS